MDMCGSEMAANLILSNAKPRLKNESTSKMAPAIAKSFNLFIFNLPPSLYFGILIASACCRHRMRNQKPPAFSSNYLKSSPLPIKI
jgi:hypothetical protein